MCSVFFRTCRSGSSAVPVKTVNLRPSKMMLITYLSFCILGVICIVLQYWVRQTDKTPAIGNNPTFLQFQRIYFAAYLPAVVADWFQGPYLYKLYSHYGFQEDQIATLYVCGFASTVLLGTWAPVAAEKFGRQKLCIVFTVTYTIACFFKLSRSYGILILGRILGGIATSLLFSSFEAWYIHEHIESNDFPKEWIAVTFSKATFWNGVLAVLAGIIANVSAEWLDLGPVSPFMLAIPCLIVSGLVVATQWKENYGKQQVKFGKSCFNGLRNIVTDSRIFLIGIIQSLFESSMYIFIFIWTPVLDPANASLGIVFSSFMVCTLIGSAIFQLLSARRVLVVNLLGGAVACAVFGYFLCIFATSPHNTNHRLAFVAFLLIEVAVGIYFPAMSNIRSRVIPEKVRLSVMNWFRVPLNLIACIILMTLHNNSFRHGSRLIFVMCTALTAIASLALLKFISIVKDDEELGLGQTQGEEEAGEKLVPAV